MFLWHEVKPPKRDFVIFPVVCAVLIVFGIGSGLVNSVSALWGIAFPPTHSGALPILLGVATMGVLPTAMVYGVDHALSSTLVSTQRGPPMSVKEFVCAYRYRFSEQQLFIHHYENSLQLSANHNSCNLTWSGGFLYVQSRSTDQPVKQHRYGGGQGNVVLCGI